MPLKDPFPSCSDPDFFSRIFSLTLEFDVGGKWEQIFDLRKEAELSFLCDAYPLQDGYRMRSQRRAQMLANFLIDDKGELRSEELDGLIEFFQERGYVSYPSSINDGSIRDHILSILIRLKEDINFYRFIKKFQRPLCHKVAESFVRDTLGEHNAQPLTDAQIRRAVLSACFSLLRQNVGSCFATAPAILIHEEQMMGMLNDLLELLSKGRLQRTFGGVEYAAPLSPSWGLGDLKKNLFAIPQVKVWMCPGLIDAFVAAGILSPFLKLEERLEALMIYVLPFLKKGGDLSADELIHEVLLLHFSLTEQELEIFERLEQSLVFGGRGFNLVGSLTAKKKDAASKMLQKEKEARAAFKRVTDHPLLKAWEFTMASFSEAKMEFSSWNLYGSLGFRPEEPDGIGEILYKHIDEKLQMSNEKMQTYQNDYNVAFDQLRGTESLLKQAYSEPEARRLQAEFNSRYYHMQICLDLRDKWHKLAANYASLFATLIDRYSERFPEYFQEIFDAEMMDLKKSQYEDSAAGFRLLYKHGRTDASLWTMIYTQEQYIESLVSFFLSIENAITSSLEWEEGKREVSELTTAVVLHLRTQEFIDSAFHRMAKALKAVGRSSPSIKIVEKKPWAYTSGGTMATLVKTYFKREGDLSVEEAAVENESDLLIFLLDTFKSLPPYITTAYVEDPKRRMLMHSPDHSFLLQPGFILFKDGWQDSGFTYTWVRDEVFLPRLHFYSAINLSSSEQKFLLQQFSLRLPPLYAHHLERGFYPSRQPITIPVFREHLLEQLKPIRAKAPHLLYKVEDLLDSFLYEMLPLTPSKQWKEKVQSLLGSKWESKMEAFLDECGDPTENYIGLKSLKQAAKAVYLYSNQSVFSSFDLHAFIEKNAVQMNIQVPPPVLFADSNWPVFTFAFLVNPGTEKLELWRMDKLGSEGFPMSDWKRWLDGSSNMKWGAYTNPFEYYFKF